jgi:hypothetical protein
MKQIVIAAALLTISAAAHAGTYQVEGVTIHVQDGCRSSSCVSVYAPEYGYYHGSGAPRVHKDGSRLAAVTQKKDAAPAPAAAAPAAAAPATEATPAKVLEAAPQAAPTDAAPAK